MGRLKALWPLFVWVVLYSAPSHAQEFLPPEQAFALSVDSSNPGDVQLTWRIHDGYYLYRDRLQVTSASASKVGTVAKPQGETKHDATFGDTTVYHGTVTVHVVAEHSPSLDVTWQGCAEAGICYPPQHQIVKVLTEEPASAVGNSRRSVFNVASKPGNSDGSEGHFAALLHGSGVVALLAAFFGIGILLAFTPCVLPMLPILSSIIVGNNGGRGRGLKLSLAFVLAMAVTYASLGVAAALAGTNLQAFLQNQWAVLGFAAIFVVLAAAMFGAFELQLPSWVRDRLVCANQRQRGGTVAGAAIMGFLSTLLVGPCMSAPLAGALLYIAQTGNAVRGGAALFALGLGMGVPLLLVGAIGARILPKPGAWMERIKTFFGFVLLLTAVWMAQRVISPSAALALWGAFILALASAAGFGTDGSRTTVLKRVTARYVGLLLGLWGASMIIGAASGADNPWQPLAVEARKHTDDSQDKAKASFTSVNSTAALEEQLVEAKDSRLPAVLDFSADWCVSCHVIDKQVFGDPQVVRALAATRRIKVDVTANSPEQRALMRQYQVAGPPTVILLDRAGAEVPGLRLVGEFEADALLGRLNLVAQRAAQ